MHGPRIVGRYELHDEFAVGGMARVCFGKLVADEGFSRIVAIKQLLPHVAEDPESVKMFIDEARLASVIRHPNVVTTLDVVRAGEELFLVMDYVAGESLAKLLAAAGAKRAKVPLPIAVAIMVDVLEGLHAAHQATSEDGVPLKIVHRDVSPQNVLVGTDGVARVVDFGVAKAVGRLQATTQAGQFKGKLKYMAPEQVGVGDIDRRCDLWAASAVLWETLTNARLFDDAADVLRFHANRDMVLPAPSERGAPPELDAVVQKGLARDPAERFQTAREMVAAIEKVCAPAPARQVAQWVQALVQGSLARRASMLEAMRTGSAPTAAPAIAATASSAPLAGSTPPLAAPAPPPFVSDTMPLAAPLAPRGPAPIPVATISTTPPPHAMMPALPAPAAAPARRGYGVLAAAIALVAIGGVALVGVSIRRASSATGVAYDGPPRDPTASATALGTAAPSADPSASPSTSATLASSAAPSASPSASGVKLGPRGFGARPVRSSAPAPSSSDRLEMDRRK